MAKTSNILATIKALRARAADAASSEAEAAAAINHADKLMREHSVTLKDLKKAQLSGGIVQAEWTKGTLKLHMVEYLASAVARLTETRGWVNRNGPEKLVFLGFEHDVEYALYIIDLAYNAMEEAWANYRESGGTAGIPANKRSSVKDTFLRGMCVRLREKLVEMAVADSLAITLPSTSSTALVVAKREMINEVFNDLGVNVAKRRKPPSGTKKHLAAPMYAGIAAGNRTNITTGIGAEA